MATTDSKEAAAETAAEGSRKKRAREAQPSAPLCSVTDLYTPAFLVHLLTARRNCRAMLERAKALGVKFRPHVKTHKTLELARLQLGYNLDGGKCMDRDESPYARLVSGIVASTLAEVRFYAEGQIPPCDPWIGRILYGVPLCPSKIDAILGTQRQFPSVGIEVLLDHPGTLSQLLATVPKPKDGDGPGPTLGVFVKVDCGYHRAGLADLDGIAALARTVVEEGERKGLLRFAGIYSHSGHSYDARGSRERILATVEEELQAMVRVHDHLKTLGLTPPTVSIGATPSCSVLPTTEPPDTDTVAKRVYKLLTSAAVPWELHPGNYVLFDVMQQSIGSCTAADIAGSVLTRVISSYPDRRPHSQLLLDAGGAALSKDRQAGEDKKGEKWGRVVAMDGGELSCGPLVIESVSQECAVVSVMGTNDEAVLPEVGECLRILPVHSCMAAMQFPEIRAWEERDGEGAVVDDVFAPVKYWS